MHFSQFWSLGNLRSGRQPVQCLARTCSWATGGQFSLSLHYRLDGTEWGPGSSFIRALILRAPPMTYTHPNGLTLHHHIGESASQLLKGQPKHSSSDFVGYSEEACLGQGGLCLLLQPKSVFCSSGVRFIRTGIVRAWC